MSDELTRRSMLATVGVAAVGALGTSEASAAQQQSSVQEVRAMMKHIGNFHEKELETVTDELLRKARSEAKEVKVAQEAEHADRADEQALLALNAQVVYGTGFFIDNGVWRFQGPGCFGNNSYFYSPKPGSYYQGAGRCSNGRYLTKVYCT